MRSSDLHPPFDQSSLKRIAYYFDFDYDASVAPMGYAEAVIAYIQDWQRHPEQRVLTAIKQAEGSLLLQDTRSDAQISQVRLSRFEKCVYQYCDRVRSLSSIVRHLHNQFSEAQFSEQDTKTFLQSLVANHLMVTDKNNYLSLALNAVPCFEVAEVEISAQLLSITV